MEYSPTHADELRGSFEGVVRVVQAADEVEDVPWHVHEVRQQVVTPRRGRGRRRVRWLSLCHSSVVNCIFVALILAGEIAAIEKKQTQF